MTQSGDPLDNAVAERANGILKTEWLYRMTIPTHKACKRELKRIISFYNDERAHMSIGNQTPSWMEYAIVKAEQSNLKVGINDEGLAQLDERNSTAISAFKQALDEGDKRINDLFTHQQKELKRIRNIEEGAYFNGRTYWWMFGIAFFGWLIVIVCITLWIHKHWI